MLTVELFLKEMEHMLCDGYSVNAGSFIATPSVKGVFYNPDEKFDPQKHTLFFRFNQGESLRKKTMDIEVEIMGIADSYIHIGQVTDQKSSSINELITPCFNIRINGKRLKLTGNHPEVGIYFINCETGLHTKIEEPDIITNYPSELTIIVPLLEAGSYQLQVTTQYVKGKILKSPRTALFNHILYVR